MPLRAAEPSTNGSHTHRTARLRPALPVKIRHREDHGLRGDHSQLASHRSRDRRVSHWPGHHHSQHTRTSTSDLQGFPEDGSVFQTARAEGLLFLWRDLSRGKLLRTNETLKQATYHRGNSRKDARSSPPRNPPNGKRNPFTIQCHFFVIDECDKVLDSDMNDIIRQLMNRTPFRKQVMMFSATLSEKRQLDYKKWMVNPMTILVD